MKRSLIFILLTLAIIIGGIYLFSKPQKSSKTTTALPSTYEYFWGDGCPHCQNVQEFLDSWDGADKVKIDKKEVWSNPNDAKLMNERASYCHLVKKDVGVPFLFTPDGKCFVGDTPIIEYLKNLQV